VLHRANSRGFTLYYYDLDILAENAHYRLVHHSCRQVHCLSHLYTVKPRVPGIMWLRTRGHDFELQLLRMNLTNETYCSFAFYLCQGGYEIVVVCLFVSLLATLCKNFQTDLHEIFMEGLHISWHICEFSSYQIWPIDK